MARSPAPVSARMADARRYNAMMRAEVLDPLFTKLRKRLAKVIAVEQAYNVTDSVFAGAAARRVWGVPTQRIQDYMNGLQGYHRSHLISAFRSSLRVDIRPVLKDPPIDAFMRQRIAENVALIKNIPAKAHADFRRRLENQLATAPFDWDMLKDTIAKEYGLAGYNLRRLTRDQTSKTIAGLTEIRQQQLGVEEYRWVTSEDERVRSSHAANNGKTFKWVELPPETGHPGHDIQCFPGSVRINPAGLKGSVAYRYVGKLVEVAVADGVNIAMTPNHPVLTESGWRRAGDLKKGDNLLKSAERQSLTPLGLYPERGDGYPFAEQLHRLLGGHIHTRRTNASRVDLHGDVPLRDVEVEVVLPPSVLRNELQFLSRQVFGDFGLELADMGSGRLTLERGAVGDFGVLGSVASRLVSGAGQGATFIGGERLHSDGVGFAGGARLVAEVAEAGGDHVSADLQVGSDLFHRLLSLPPSKDLGVEESAPFKVTPVTRWRMFDFDGIVHSFETSTGLIIANGIVTHNCRCVAIAIIPDKLVTEIKDAKKSKATAAKVGTPGQTASERITEIDKELVNVRRSISQPNLKMTEIDQLIRKESALVREQNKLKRSLTQEPPPPRKAAGPKKLTDAAYMKKGKEILDEMEGHFEGYGYGAQFVTALKARLQKEGLVTTGRRPSIKPAGNRRQTKTRTRADREADRVAGAKLSADLEDKFPDTWLNKAGDVYVRNIDKGDGYYGHRGSYGASDRTIEMLTPGSKGAVSTTGIHEFTHHLQSKMKALDGIFARELRRRTKGEKKELIAEDRKTGFKQYGWRDRFLMSYWGVDSEKEIIAMAFQTLWNTDRASGHTVRDLYRQDPDMLRLILGVLFNYKP